jgi:nucleoside-diphosphate-sugar epimerase
MPSPTVLVLGANGRFGQAAAQAFAAAGWRVLAQTRRPLAFHAANPRHAPPAAADRPGAIQPMEIALEQADEIVHRAAGASVVVYGVNPLYTRWPQEVLPLARAGMDIAQRLGATFMLPGNVYNFGERMPALLTEGTPERPTTDKGRLRCDMEAEMAARAQPAPGAAWAPMRSIVVRAGDFFGCGEGTWIDQLIARSIRAGKLSYPGPMDTPHAWAYLPDLAQAFVALAAVATAPSPALPAAARFHFAGHTLTGAQLLDAIEAAARQTQLLPPGAPPLRRRAFAWWAVRAVAWAVPLWRELVKMSYLWRVPHALDGRLLAQTVGGVPATPLPEALRASLRTLLPATSAAAPRRKATQSA